MKTEKLYHQYVNAETDEEKFEIIIHLLTISDEFDDIGIDTSDTEFFNKYEASDFLGEFEDDIVRIWKKTIK